MVADSLPHLKISVMGKLLCEPPMLDDWGYSISALMKATITLYDQISIMSVKLLSNLVLMSVL